jgi:metal-responsive CopG/Arc/MetJ family transcriptional regulator
MAKEANVVVRLDEDLVKRLDDVVTASRLGTRSDHIRKAITEYVERHEPAPVPA